jgi:hypothetical protein
MIGDAIVSMEMNEFIIVDSHKFINLVEQGVTTNNIDSIERFYDKDVFE